MKKLYILLFTILISGTSFGQEMLLNGGFESWDSPTAPTSFEKAESTAQESTEFHSGTYSAKHTGGTTDIAQTISGITPGASYTVSLWYKVDSGFGDGTDARIWSYWRTGTTTIGDNANELRGPNNAYFDNNGNVWTQYSVTVTAPATADNFYFEVRTYGTAVVYWDDFSFFAEAPSVDPTILVSGAVSGLDYEVGSGPSEEQTFTVGGSNLTNDIVLTSPTDFEISETSGSGFGAGITLTEAGGTVAVTTIYVRLKSGLTLNNYAGNVDVTSTGAAPKTVSLSGDVVNPPPSLPFTENFDYGLTAGDLITVSGGNWTNLSGTLPIGYQTTSLSMSGYAASGVGGAITIDDNGASAEDASTPFANQSSGSIYLSALVNISSFVATGDDYFMFLNTGFNYYARLYAKDDGGGNLKFGILEHSSSTVTQYSSSNYAYNTTYLIVLKYDFSTGTSSVYVLDNAAATEPVSADAESSDGTDVTNLDSMGIRQGNDTPIATIDGIRVGTSWASAVLSTKDKQIEGFSFYPNPTNLGYVNISSKNSARMDVAVFDILGKQVLNKTVRNNTLDVSGLTSGIYIMKVSQENAIITKKLVIQ